MDGASRTEGPMGARGVALVTGASADLALHRHGSVEWSLPDGVLA